ncbi:hypothetical protein [Lentzea jiangxiensis]|uniref:Uncharacterized protein n=1 Tax=Lentzea jiangxiensis TaxID=641025 RepID=A0A1H0JX70_9PSEU|nr:hypothetical protein [Lentzea jiangxiensis]SDO48112.1 hypothetical protein SAMN05421507_102670 [Lentzea jiangxiensis]
MPLSTSRPASPARPPARRRSGGRFTGPVPVLALLLAFVVLMAALGHDTELAVAAALALLAGTRAGR